MQLISFRLLTQVILDNQYNPHFNEFSNNATMHYLKSYVTLTLSIIPKAICFFKMSCTPTSSFLLQFSSIQFLRTNKTVCNDQVKKLIDCDYNLIFESQVNWIKTIIDHVMHFIMIVAYSIRLLCVNTAIIRTCSKCDSSPNQWRTRRNASSTLIMKCMSSLIYIQTDRIV